MKIRLKWLVGGIVVIAGLLQLTNPARTNPPVTAGHDLLATNPPPADVAATLQAACYDCHSFQTEWPWYSRVAPASWLLVDHVNGARKRLNFSEWPHDDPERAAKKWRHVADQVRSGEMPLPSYTWIHTASRLNAGQRDRLAQWADQEARRLQPGAAGALQR